MKPNIGRTDKAIRIFSAVTMTALYITGIATGWVGYLLLATAFSLLVTVAFNWCPMCQILHLDTCEIERR
jgi:hypothetical protein